MLASTLLVGSPPEQSKALDGYAQSARSPSGQVRIFRAGQFVGGGTLVARNWVLTALHVLAATDLGGQVVRFGVVDGAGDANDVAHLRPLAQIVPHPEADLAMVRLTDNVPDGVWIPRLATQAPTPSAAANLYGWGPRRWLAEPGRSLFHTETTILDPAAAENAAARRATDQNFARMFPASVAPIVVNAMSVPGDSGSGTFTAPGVLAGVHTGVAGYQYLNAQGRAAGEMFRALYDQPVWWYRRWIESVINGEGTSGSTTHDELRRRRLDEVGGALPMTGPPQTNICDVDDASCVDPRWLKATLTGRSQGAALVTCDGGEADGCTFAGKTYAPGTSAVLSLGAAGGTGMREALVWCTSTPANSTDQKLKLSFTNADAPDRQLGYGWWLVTRDFLRSVEGNTTDLSVC
ncbi:MAG TPA: trypsin-like serine protease [Kineosporiaceae bacterium]